MFTARYGRDLYIQFYVLPTHCMCFVWISEQTAIISLYSINWLVFIIETECVYCAVRTGSLNETATVSSLKVKFQVTWIVGTWAIISETQSSREQRTYVDSEISAVAKSLRDVGQCSSCVNRKQGGKTRLCCGAEIHVGVAVQQRDLADAQVSSPSREPSSMHWLLKLSEGKL